MLPLDLAALYKQYNQQFFDNGLPIIPVRWAKTPRGVAGYFWMEEADKMSIVIHPLIRKWGLRRYAKLILLHEMAHVKLRNRKIQDHGRIFNNEMKRLANAGAFENLW